MSEEEMLKESGMTSKRTQESKMVMRVSSDGMRPVEEHSRPSLVERANREHQEQQAQHGGVVRRPTLSNLVDDGSSSPHLTSPRRASVNLMLGASTSMKSRKHAHAAISAEQMALLSKQARAGESVWEKLVRYKNYLHELKQVRAKREKKEAQLMETIILEKTIIKLGGLCALAFGEAGSAVVAHNMDANDTTSALKTMVDGKADVASMADELIEERPRGGPVVALASSSFCSCWN